MPHQEGGDGLAKVAVGGRTQEERREDDDGRMEGEGEEGRGRGAL